MPMEGLLALVDKLRERIDSHGAALKGSEALTRYALIDPLLRELGWDTSDPEMVIPEYSAGGGRADYALLSDGKPVMMVEAKSLGSSLQGALNQAINYSISGTGNKARYFSVTDGANWVIYDTSKPPAEMSVVCFDLKGPSAAEACLQALSLWRPSVISGSVQPGKVPRRRVARRLAGYDRASAPCSACRSATARHKRTRMGANINIEPSPKQPSATALRDFISRQLAQQHQIMGWSCDSNCTLAHG